MTISSPRAGDEENRFPAHYSGADLMARFSSTGGYRYNNGKDRVALLAMYIIILHILCPDHRRPRLHHPGANSKVSPSSGSSCPHCSKTYLLLASCRGIVTADVLVQGLSHGAIAARKLKGVKRDKGHEDYTGLALTVKVKAYSS